MIVVGVDPGIRGTGIACFQKENNKSKLVHAEYVKNSCAKGNKAAECVAMARAVKRAITFAVIPLPPPYELAVEFPRIYATRIREGLTKEDPNDLLALAAVVTAIGSELNIEINKITSYCPPDWKGQIPKHVKGEKEINSIMRARVYTRLDADEKKIMDASEEDCGSKFHNVVDSAGIGLFFLGRLDRVRIYPTE